MCVLMLIYWADVLVRNVSVGMVRELLVMR